MARQGDTWAIPRDAYLPREMVRRVLRHLADKADKRDYTITLLLFRCGLRPGEALALTIGDVYRDGEVVKHLYIRPETTKTGEGRTIPVHSEVRVKLAAFLKQKRLRNRQATAADPERMYEPEPLRPILIGGQEIDPPLFVSRERGADGEPRAVTRDQLGKVFQKLRRELDLPSWFTPHKGRHFVGTSLVHADPDRDWEGDITTARDVLGHRDIAMTAAAYTRTPAEARKRAMGVLAGVQ